MNLLGIHDREGAHVVPSGGWCVDTVALSANPAPTNYNQLRADINWLVRLNWGYGSTGTFPKPEAQYGYAMACANYAAASRGVYAYILGNESNHENERPDGFVLSATSAALAFLAGRDAIKRAVPNARVMPPPIAPYHANPTNWLDYLRQMLAIIAQEDGCDGIAIHAYTRTPYPADIASDAKMGAPLQTQYSGFRVYRDALSVVPASLRHLPVYITEFDELDGWVDANTGVIQAACAEIDGWNKTPNTQKVRALVCYRWPKITDGQGNIVDKWYIEGKQGVIDDFNAAAAKGYQSHPEVSVAEQPNQVFVPLVTTAPALPAPDLSADFKRRVPQLELAQPAPGQHYYRLIKAEYVPDGARRFGPDHHILVDVLDANGQRQMGAPINFFWGSGMDIATVNKAAGTPYGADFGMTAAGHSYGVWVGDFRQNSDSVFGMGLGKIGSEHMGEHVTYYLVFQEMVNTPLTQPAPPPPVVVQPPSAVPPLVHPITNPTLRIVSQRFGEHPEDYARFGLAGHNGIDFAVPEGTPIRAVANGWAAEVLHDTDGYGRYVKLIHPWGESLYAHLRAQAVNQGEQVLQGQLVGESGNTGNSTGPHLHFSIRVNPYVRGYPFDGFVNPEPYLDGAKPPSAQEPVLMLIQDAAKEFDFDWHLIAAQAMAESSFDPRAESSTGARGLMQLTPATWNEFAPKVGATDIWNAKDNSRVGCAYMAWLRRTLSDYGDRATHMALIAYGWGIGNLLAKKEEPPLTWRMYASNIYFGAELLKGMEGIK